MNRTRPSIWPARRIGPQSSNPARPGRAASRILSALGIAVALAVLCIPQIGLAPKLSANTIDLHASLSTDGTRIVLTGPIRCTQEEWVDMRVTVTQRTTGALAEGRLRLRGSTIEQHWELIANALGSADFEAGDATAVAMAVTTRKGVATDAHQWLVPIELSVD
jgi:hypothetical protein